MTFAEAAQRILEQAKEPLHFREITRRAIALGLIEVQGDTPWNSMNGTLRRTIRREGSTSEVVSVGEGCFALRRWGLPQEDLDDPASMTAAEMLSGLDYKWRAIHAKGVSLFTAHYEHPVKRGIQRSLSLICVWGITNLLAAVSLLLGQDSAVARGLGAQLLNSSLGNVVLAWVGSDWLAVSPESERAKCEPINQVTSELVDQVPIYAASLLFGAIHLWRGGCLARRSETQSRRRGKGLGLLLQGGFYVTLALVGLWLAGQEQAEE